MLSSVVAPIPWCPKSPEGFLLSAIALGCLIFLSTGTRALANHCAGNQTSFSLTVSAPIATRDASRSVARTFPTG